MDIKKLIIVMVFVVGVTPNNTRTACTSCDENDESSWQIISEEEQEAAEPLISFVKKHRPQPQCSRLPYYQSHPANVSFHTQTKPCEYEDPYAPCDEDFAAREMEEEELQAEEQPYVVIYKVK
jgi:hypothetical protein